MSRRFVFILTLCFSFIALSALAEHAVLVRGMISLPESRSVLLEVKHFTATTVGTRKISHPPIITTRWAKEGEVFEDQTIKGAHVKFEIVKIAADGKVTLRDDGKEMVCALDGASKVADDKRFGIQFNEARFRDVLDLYSGLKDRTLLIHPTIAHDSATIQSDVSDQAGVASALEKFFRERGIATVAEGDRFVLLVPADLKMPLVPHFKPSNTDTNPAGSVFLNTSLSDAMRNYGALFHKTPIPNRQVPEVRIFLNTKMLSKPEFQYAFDTILGWNGLRIVSTNDSTFMVVHAPEANR